MSFGFPALHTESTPGRSDGVDTLDFFRTALVSIGWIIVVDQGGRIEASTSPSLFSWGERVVIAAQSSGSLEVTSRSSVYTDPFDWGRNKSNVKKLLDCVRAIERDRISGNPR